MVKDAFGRDWALDDMKDCVGRGWWPIVEVLYDLCDKQNVAVTQVKEKFGGLRFYTEGCSDETLAVIAAMEALSLKMCENCGRAAKPSTGREGYWVRTWCSICKKHGVKPRT